VRRELPADDPAAVGVEDEAEEHQAFPAALVLIVSAIVSNTLTQVFRVALYRFATGAPVASGFASEDLEAAFRPKRRHRRTR
jgi:hypothetical protein